jgi:hypothetical protein
MNKFPFFEENEKKSCRTKNKRKEKELMTHRSYGTVD